METTASQLVTTLLRGNYLRVMVSGWSARRGTAVTETIAWASPTTTTMEREGEGSTLASNEEILSVEQDLRAPRYDLGTVYKTALL